MMRYCGKCYNEGLHNLYSSPNAIGIIMSRKIKWEGHLTLMEEKRNEYIILVGKPFEKTPLRISRHR
jgi:hypothetical protein